MYKRQPLHLAAQDRSVAGAEPPINKKRTRTLFRKESGSSTNCMVEHQGVEPWHLSLIHIFKLQTAKQNFASYFREEKQTQQER